MMVALPATGARVRICYTTEQESLRADLRAWYDHHLDATTVEALRAENGGGPVHQRVWKQMCKDGWAGIGWPIEYGGQGRSAIEQFIFFDESMRAGAPVPMLSLNSVGPAIMNFGSDEQKLRFLPGLLSGDLRFCIGYSEPESGTDLASLSTTAVRDGDEYVINGQKMWTSESSFADYCWLAVRTNPDVKKHKGLSILTVPMGTAGITLQPLDLLSTHDINAVHFDDVRVPIDACIGGENNGWTLITNQLNHERVTLCSSGIPERVYEDAVAWAKHTLLPDGRRIIDQAWVQLTLARVHAKLEALRLMNQQSAWEATRGVLDIGHCSAIKVYGTDYYLEAFRLLMEVYGPAAYVAAGSPGAIGHARIQTLFQALTILTFGGGTNEMQRDLITMFSLGFPRAAR